MTTDKPNAVKNTHGGAGGGDEDGYDMTGSSGPTTHRDVRNYLSSLRPAHLGATITRTLRRYVDGQASLLQAAEAECQQLYAAFAGSAHSPKNPREAKQAIEQMSAGGFEAAGLELARQLAAAEAECARLKGERDRLHDDYWSRVEQVKALEAERDKLRSEVCLAERLAETVRVSLDKGDFVHPSVAGACQEFDLRASLPDAPAPLADEHGKAKDSWGPTVNPPSAYPKPRRPRPGEIDAHFAAEQASADLVASSCPKCTATDGQCDVRGHLTTEERAVPVASPSAPGEAWVPKVGDRVRSPGWGDMYDGTVCRIDDTGLIVATDGRSEWVGRRKDFALFVEPPPPVDKAEGKGDLLDSAGYALDLSESSRDRAEIQLTFLNLQTTLRHILDHLKALEGRK